MPAPRIVQHKAQIPTITANAKTAVVLKSNSKTTRNSIRGDTRIRSQTRASKNKPSSINNSNPNDDENGLDKVSPIRSVITRNSDEDSNPTQDMST